MTGNDAKNFPPKRLPPQTSVKIDAAYKNQNDRKHHSSRFRSEWPETIFPIPSAIDSFYRNHHKYDANDDQK